MTRAHERDTVRAGVIANGNERIDEHSLEYIYIYLHKTEFCEIRYCCIIVECNWLFAIRCIVKRNGRIKEHSLEYLSVGENFFVKLLLRHC